MSPLLSSIRDTLRELASGPRMLAFLASLVSIALILVGAAIVSRVLGALVRRALPPRGDRFLDEARARTLQPLVESLLRYVIYFIALVMVLREAGVDATAILASAGVVGLAVGFGAQHLIRDVISGFFILAEGLVHVGDVITVDGHTGLVERVSIRTTHIREYTGELWTIPNGQLQIFGNANRDFSRAIVEAGVSYEADVQRTMATMQRVGETWAAQHADVVLAPPEVQGITQFGDSQVVVRLVIMVKPLQQAAAERDLRRGLKEAFAREGIQFPAPQRVAILPLSSPARRESGDTPS